MLMHVRPSAEISEQLALFEDDRREFMGMEGFGLPKRAGMLKQLKRIQRNSGWYRHRDAIVWVVGMAPDGQWIALKDQGHGEPLQPISHLLR